MKLPISSTISYAKVGLQDRSNVNIAYLCDDFTGELLTLTDETTDLKWFGFDELPE